MKRKHNGQLIFISGRNGARFFLTANSWREWLRSLEFYRAVTLRAELKKLAMFLAYPLLKMRAALSADDVVRIVAEQLKAEIELPEVDCSAFSAMISPTGDKAVFHFHGCGYYKVAVGGSLSGVVGELTVYKLLADKRVQSFAFSAVSHALISADQVEFFMEYAPGKHFNTHPEAADLLTPLQEFFALADKQLLPWKQCWENLALPELSGCLPADFFLGNTPVGLVHRDFKPWNVKSGAKPLFYDFESVCWSGCPMEDFFNYIVDPLLRQITPGQVVNAVLKDYRKTAGDMLSKYHLPESEFMRYWCWYLLERIAFWRQHGEAEFAEHFAVMFKLTIQKIES